MNLPDLLSVSEIHGRLQTIFPDGCPNRRNCTWEIAARTVFVMLYMGAIEGNDQWMRPDQVTRMTDAQAKLTGEKDRLSWAADSRRPGKGEISGRWYAVNTRESIRDDTLRNGLIANGAVVEREGLATTSPSPRYALGGSFADLFLPTLRGGFFEKAISDWQEDSLTPAALARITMLRRGAAVGGDFLLVQFPNGETRRMAPGPSSVISKAVLEEFAPRFLEDPAVVSLSESRNKVIARDEELAKSIGLHIRPERHLPDIILADLGPKQPTLVFVEVVATDGPISAERKTALLQIASQGGFQRPHVAFVTAFMDRDDAAFKRCVASISWGSSVWFASEPQHIVRFEEGNESNLGLSL